MQDAIRPFSAYSISHFRQNFYFLLRQKKVFDIEYSTDTYEKEESIANP